MNHLYLHGKNQPVCGTVVAKGEPTGTQVFYSKLCKLCVYWQTLRSKQLQRQHREKRDE